MRISNAAFLLILQVQDKGDKAALFSQGKEVINTMVIEAMMAVAMVIMVVEYAESQPIS